jgi:TRAP-type C4-dicarboxylate transport system permease small subunit
MPNFPNSQAAPVLQWAAGQLTRVSGWVFRLEKFAVTSLMFLLAFLILLNVVTRYSGSALYWVDESAVYSVVWLSFIGASAMTRLRLDFAVTLLTDQLSEGLVRTAKVAAGLGVVLFALLLAWMCWLWLDPPGIIAAGVDAKAYGAKTFNFVYAERTQTLNWPTWLLYCVVPLFSITMAIHGLANVVEDLGWTPRSAVIAWRSGATDGIN